MKIRQKSLTDIGKKIEQIRIRKSIKQDTLANKIGMTQGTYSKMLQSEISDGELQKIAEALEMPVEDIKNYSEEKGVNIVATTVNTHDQSASVNYHPSFNPIDKIIALFEENKKI